MECHRWLVLSTFVFRNVTYEFNIMYMCQSLQNKTSNKIHPAKPRFHWNTYIALHIDHLHHKIDFIISDMCFCVAMLHPKRSRSHLNAMFVHCNIWYNREINTIHWSFASTTHSEIMNQFESLSLFTKQIFYRFVYLDIHLSI